MRFLVAFILAAVFISSGIDAKAESPIPERRHILSKDVDFYGSDLATLFDKTFQSCRRACLLDKRCKAFTYNRRSNACFPKSAVEEERPYAGAISGRVVETPAALIARAEVRQREADFLHEPDFTAARDLAERITTLYFPAQTNAEELIGEAYARQDPAEALRYAGAALVLTDRAGLWIRYAELALKVPREETERYREIRAEALPAAVNAWLRSEGPGEKAAALVVMARALERDGRGRDMIPALTLASHFVDDPAITKALERAIAKYGFRIVEDTVNSDLAEPRICATFSEDLVQAGLDYRPYLKLPSNDMPIEVAQRQICVGGLEHGQRYQITFRAGLPAANGEKLLKSVTIRHYVRDRRPIARFPGRGYVLPRAADAALPIETVNLTEVDLVLRRVSDRNLLRAMQDGYFARPLSIWETESFASDVAEEIWRGKGEVRMELNREVTTRLPMGEIIAGLPAGIYALEARVPGADPYDNPASTQWFALSDLGMTSLKGVDGVHVFIRSLLEATPKQGVKVTLLSRANAVLAEAETDARGYARFPAAIAAGTGSRAPALLIAREEDRDIAFLSLSGPAFDLSDRGVEGRAPAEAIDAFVTTDRGAYRAGDTVHVTALLRGPKAEALEGIPLTAILRRPDGIEYTRKVSAGDLAGGHVFAFPIGATAQRGGWRLSLHADTDAPALATAKFLVEDFIPERIDFSLSLPEGPLDPAAPPPLTLEARYLFGAPAADMSIEGELRLNARDEIESHPGYRFGRHDQPFEPRSEALPVGIRTDKAGKALIPLVFPEREATTHPLEATITVRVSEGSGRPVEREITRPLAPAAPMIGIRPLFDDVVAENGTARFRLIALDTGGNAAEIPVRYTINRVNTRYQWYQSGGRWNWEPVTTRTLVKSDEVVIPKDAPLEISAPVEWGEYEIRVERLAEGAGGQYVASSVPFAAGWYAAADAAATPDVLEVSLDRTAYRPGDTARLRLVPRTAGKALITVMSNRLIDMKAVDVTAGENIVELPVTDEWGAGAYVTATVIRPMDVAAKHNPARALGLSYAAVDPGDHRLAASLSLPGEIRPRGPLDVALRVANVKPGEQAYATIAAVDLGILNMTRFKSPDPAGHYFGQRRLGMEIRDLYGRLIDGMNGAMGRVRSGGDAESDASPASPPPTEELVSFFTGPVEIGADGTARARFDLPAFNGTLRIMAVVWSKTGVGAASGDVIVRDPVVLTASLPRFLAPGDQSRLLLEITNADAPAGEIGIDLQAEGLRIDKSAMPASIALGEKETARLSVPISGTKPGTYEMTVALALPGGERLEKTLTLAVVDNDPVVTRTSRFDLASGDTFTFTRDVFAGMRPGTGSATLAAGPLARLDAPGLLTALDRYPYGCTEQITSKAMPLLYLSDVAEALGLGRRKAIPERVNQAIESVLNNQSPNGAFGLWQPDQGDMWLDAYVSDFLSRARARGYAVSDTAFRMAMDNLLNQVNYYGDFDKGGEDLAYALMVLAREGAAAIGDLRYYADVKRDAFTTPLAAAQLGAALAFYGDQPRADRMFAQAARLIARDAAEGEPPLWRADYGTARRDAAAVLALASEAGSTMIDRETAVKFIAAGGAPGTRSTQEAAWALLAAKALVADPSMAGFTINGTPASGPIVRLIEDDAAAAPLAITNETGKRQTLTLTTFGVPERPLPAGGNGYAIERRYYTMDGIETDITAHEGMKVGTRLVAVITVHPLSAREARLIINDPLPAGYEIDNPDILQGGNVRALDWLELPDSVHHSEARSDRFIAAVDWSSDKPLRLAYILRATTPGEYHQPPASVEDMYRPEMRAHSDPARVRVVK